MDNKFYYLFICTVLLFISCKRSTSESTSEHTSTIKVKEYKTNIPLSGVLVSLFKCSNYDAVFGCRSTSLIGTYTTDQQGECIISDGELNRANQGMILSKFQYWNMNGYVGEITMEPEAWVKIALSASRTYPDTSIFEIQTIGQSGVKSFQSFKPPKDSSINFRLFGNEMNKVNWVLYTKDARCFLYCLFDTLSSGSLSFNPQKFEALASSLNY
jgi:hypothetical protein